LEPWPYLQFLLNKSSKISQEIMIMSFSIFQIAYILWVFK